MPASGQPRRIVLILPCCIGDVVLASASLIALRARYPDSHITWAVGSWSRAVIERHPALNAVLDTGRAALPIRSVGGFLRFVRQLRGGRFDLAVSLVRSPLMSLALALSGIPVRAGLDSAGRGFGYTVRVPIAPDQERHEAEIYLDVIRALGGETPAAGASIPPHADDLAAARAALESCGITGPFAVINPAGGSNPGMTMDAKRYPPAGLAAIARGLREDGLAVLLVGGPDDGLILSAVQREIRASPPLPELAGTLTLPQYGALAALSALYVGNDTGMTHLAAASGAKTVMLMGPSSPRRYAPFAPDSLVLWKPVTLPDRGVAAGSPLGWDWTRDGIPPEEALAKIRAFLGASHRAAL